MRIVSGKYRGRLLKSPLNNRIRPTADRTKEAVFSSLESRIGVNGCKFMDAFCGSGAMGLEAASRGASSVYMMDIDTRLARDNASGYKDENIHIITCDVLKPVSAPKVMDVVFIDPPYAMEAGAKAIVALKETGWANAETLFVVETDKDDKSIVESEYSYCEMKRYGKTVVYFIKSKK